MKNRVFICFAAEDRYRIVEPIVYHLKNYGVNVWYDRYSLVMGDNRVKKNLLDGACKCEYATVILSSYTAASVCAMEELKLIEERYRKGEITVFPVLYEMHPSKLPQQLGWVKELIFKEVNKQSGTYEICNHIACKITNDILASYAYQTIPKITSNLQNSLPLATFKILIAYQELDAANLNSRVALLYAAYLTTDVEKFSITSQTDAMIEQIFKRLFSETKLNLSIDYRELWLLENALCISLNHYVDYSIESSI